MSPFATKEAGPRRGMRLERVIMIIEALLLCAAVSVFVWFGIRVFSGPFLPSSEVNDGFGYFMGAKSFFINHQLRAPAIFLDNVSSIGEFYAHGFVYSLINGGVALIVGWHNKLIVAVNVILLVAAGAFVLMRREAWRWKLILLLLFLTFYLTPTMTFAFMQETIHLLLALIVGQFLMMIFDQEDDGRRKRLLLGYYVLIAVVALMRPTWAFWAVGPLALTGTRRDFAVLGGLAAFSIVLGYLYLKLLFAPYPYYTPYAATSAALADHEYVAAVRAIFEFLRSNAAKLFVSKFYIFGTTYIPNLYTLLVIAVTFYLLECYRRVADRRALAVALVGIFYIAAILVMYDVLAGARTIGVVFVLQLVYLVAARRRALVAGLALFQVAMFPSVVGITNHIIDVQSKSGDYAARHADWLRTIHDIGPAIEAGHRATVYLDNALTNSEYPVNIHLPLRSGDGYPLRYSLDLVASLPMIERRFDAGFIDYVLTAQRLSRADLTPVRQSGNLYLYRVKRE